MLEISAMEEIWKREEPEAWERLQAWKEGRTGFPWIVSVSCFGRAECGS